MVDVVPLASDMEFDTVEAFGEEQGKAPLLPKAKAKASKKCYVFNCEGHPNGNQKLCPRHKRINDCMQFQAKVKSASGKQEWDTEEKTVYLDKTSAPMKAKETYDWFEEQCIASPKWAWKPMAPWMEWSHEQSLRREKGY